MAVSIKLSEIPKERHEEILRDLTVTPIDVTFETMKKRGKIAPGYLPKSDTSFSVYFIHVVDGEKYINMPYHYAKTRFSKTNDDIEHRLIPGIPDTLKYAIELREAQVNHAITCLNHLEKTGSTIVGLPPGFGKTFIGSWLSYHTRLMTLIVVPREPLLKQWKHTYNTAIPGAKVWIVGVNDKEFFTDTSSFIETTMPDIVICLDPRLEKIPQDIRSMIGTMIIDEAHLMTTPSRIRGLLSICPKYVILETATLERADGLHQICHLISGKHGVFKISKDSYTVYDVHLPFIEPPVVYNSLGVDYGALCKDLATNEIYNSVIVGIIKANPNRKYILLTRLVPHAKLLKKLLENEGITSDTLVGTQKKYTDSKVLIGTLSKIGVGFDEATASDTFAGRKSDTLILCHSVKQIPNFEQYRGRVMRVENPIIYWLTPNSVMVKNHLRGLKKWIAETNGKLITVDGSQFV